MKPSRISNCQDRIIMIIMMRFYFIIKMFDRFNYKALINIFQLNLLNKTLIVFTKHSPSNTGNEH